MYFGDFKDREDVEAWAGEALNGAIILAAVYHNEDYSGDAMVVFRKDGKLFEVHDSHCSCDGLANWEPEEISAEALMARIEQTEKQMSDRYGNEFYQAVKRGLFYEYFEKEVLVG